MTGVESAVASAIAGKLAAKLSQPAVDAATQRIRAYLGRSRSQRALRDALLEASRNFSKAEPAWANSLFDGHFFRNRAEPCLLKALDPDAEAAASDLAEAWLQQFRTAAEAKPSSELLAACETFLRMFRHAVRTQDYFRKQFDSAGIDWIATRVDELAKTLDYAGGTATAAQFSDQIRETYAGIGQAVETLTSEQFRVIEMLRHFRRALISGSAGSGKTLVAAENARRLDRAGVKTLVACHNPELARWFRVLVRGTTVDVVPFEDLVSPGRSTSSPRRSTRWSAYSEPTSADLALALDRLLAQEERYSAQIVDEGQDFRDDWWTVLEACAVDDPLFYIFLDDQQSLMPRRASYPIDMPPWICPRNCRNAGQIYEAMRVLSPRAPEPEAALARFGSVQFVASHGDMREAVADAFLWPHQRADLASTVALLGGGKPLAASVFGSGFLEAGPTDWRSEIARALARIAERRRVALSLSFVKSKLSGSVRPLREDVTEVRRLARAIAQADRQPYLSHGTVHGLRRRDIEPIPPHDLWEASAGWRRTDESLITYTFGGWGHTDEALLEALLSGAWAETLPPRGKIDVQFCSHHDPAPGAVSVFSVGEFKGLESEAVLLVMDGEAPELRNELFVGRSRARSLVAAVIDRATASLLRPGEVAALQAITAPD
jgi:hypothetical protein